MSRSQSDWQNRRRSGRRHLKGKFIATCRKGDLDLGPNLALSVAEVSETGLGLLVNENLRCGQQVSVTLEGPSRMSPAKLKGLVVWSAPTEQAGVFRVGIALDKPLDRRMYLNMT